MDRGSVCLVEVIAPRVLHHFAHLAVQVATLGAWGHDREGILPAAGEVMPFVAQGREGRSPSVSRRTDQAVESRPVPG